jgi:hypothetical protein
MKERSSEKRRSDRLMITLPLVVEGKDTKDQPFDNTARTTTVNRHGARIVTPRPLRAGQTITVTNLASRKKCQFRVVGPVSPATDRGGEWGIECLDPNKDIWGIQFPPVLASDEIQSKALLECQDCGTNALMRVSLIEVEVLETSGILTKPCTQCERETTWHLSEKQTGMVAVAADPSRSQGVKPASARGAENRRHRRSSLQLPVLIRDYYGGSEVTRTENVSKGGFCFVSEKHHPAGEILLVACPYDPSTTNHIEVRAQVVRALPIEGSVRKVYGVRYER